MEGSGKAGWPIPEWCSNVGIARPTFYTLPAEARPPMVSIGRKRIVTESPASWIERMREAGGVKALVRTKRQAA